MTTVSTLFASKIASYSILSINGYSIHLLYSYNIQCPSNFNLHYTLVRRNIQPLSSDGECLDFLRMWDAYHYLNYGFTCYVLYTGYHFTATGQNIDTDVCGSATDTTPSHFVNGFHGSSLNLEFRSNRVVTNAGFFLAITCINPAPFRVTRQAEQGFQQRRDCVTSRLLPGYRVGKKKRSIQPFDMVWLVWSYFWHWCFDLIHFWDEGGACVCILKVLFIPYNRTKYFISGMSGHSEFHGSGSPQDECSSMKTILSLLKRRERSSTCLKIYKCFKYSTG